MAEAPTLDMAKKKPPKPARRREPDDERKPIAVQMRASVAYKQWVEALVRFEDRPLSTILERALRQYAKTAGFEREPPER